MQQQAEQRVAVPSESGHGQSLEGHRWKGLWPRGCEQQLPCWPRGPGDSSGPVHKATAPVSSTIVRHSGSQCVGSEGHKRVLGQ